jgi:hypothetical protein
LNNSYEKNEPKELIVSRKMEKSTYNPGIECGPKQADQASAEDDVVNVCALNDRVDLE